MKTNYLILFVLLFACTVELHAQIKSYEFPELNGDTQEQRMLLVESTSFFSNESVRETSTYEAGNNVLIQQVGKSNIISTSISSPNAVVNLNQRGNDNYMKLDIHSPLVRESVEQIGNNNYFFDFGNNPLKENQLNLQQHGNNTLVVKYGANSISDQISYKVEGDYKTLIIKNYP